jgi:hypothetical protein
MIDCRKCRELAIEAAYGELGPADREAFDRHVAACPACAAELEGVAETLRLMDRRERTDPGPAFWDGYWDRLSRRIVWEAAGETKRPSPLDRLGRLFPRPPRWAFQLAGAAALVLVGILIGLRLVGTDGRPVRPGTAVAAAGAGAPSSAVVQAGEFVERSRVLLLGLVNFDPAVDDAYALDLDRQRAVSRELVAAAPAIRGGLNEPGQRRLRELVADLEVIMMQIANLESGQDLEGVELVKQGVDRKGLLLKIDLDRMSRESSGGPAAAPAGKKSRV